MSSSPVLAEGEDGLRVMQAILSESVAAGGPRYIVHPGDIAWWIHHSDPREDDKYWLWDDWGFAAVDTRYQTVDLFARPNSDRSPIIEWAQTQLGGAASIGYVAETDEEFEEQLTAAGYQPGSNVMTHFVRDLKADETPPASPPGWELRPLAGEHEADARREPSHAAFKSTMDPAQHLQRYLTFMRSPVYDAERDLVAISPEGRVGAFLVWWPDPSGFAELEPVGTHPDLQRQGLGRALMDYACARMAAAGMTEVRVATDDWREDAMGFYAGAGFSPIRKLRWWEKKS